MKVATILLIAAFGLISAASGQISTGGAYGMEQSVTASGGGNSNATVYTLVGTTGQAAAGFTSTSSIFGLYGVKGGFWLPMPPTQANPNVSISGRVFINSGRGITNARVTLSGGNLTTPIVVFTGRYGSFRFENIQAGHTYTVSVLSRRFTFSQPVQMISVMNNITDIVFQVL
ncbi:MAG: carboxypeptidase regulatory-like domain-containing protein [Chloracidobacterium sp.]|nr:carboxypeptidase regulatory-like domain-containing protein [Chloracidobacterium sp.]